MSKVEAPGEINDLVDLMTPEEKKIFHEMTEEAKEDYKEIFNIFDTDGGGSISSDEVAQVMRTLG
jgi:Ca2+-binding EF-hand superfamily protein